MSDSTIEVVGTVDRTNASDAASKLRKVKFAKIQWDRGRNPRQPASYSEAKIAWLARSIFDNGLLKEPVLSQRSNGDLIGLCGHLRGAAIELVRTKGLAAVKASDGVLPKEALPPQPNFMDEIDCIVKSGLSLNDELDLMMDHGTVTMLNAIERYNAIRTMCQAGFKQERIAEKMNLSRGAIQPAVNLVRMPKCVEDVFLDESETALELNNDTIKVLYTAYKADVDNNDCKIKEVGPKFAAEWEKFIAKGKVTRVKVLSADTLKNLASAYNDPDIRDLLSGVAAGKSEDVGDAIKRIMLRMVPVGCVPFNQDRQVFQEEGIVNTVLNGVPVTV